MKCPFCERSVDGGSARFCPSCGAALAESSSGGPAPSSVGRPGADPFVGQLVGGKFRIIRLLGEGGMGAVYEGEQSLGSARRKVAVKTLHPHLSRDPKIEARFEREVATISELEHPNTIQVYDFGSTPEGVLYFVMEFLHGRSVGDWLSAEGALAPDRTSHVLEQICGSLEEAHGRGIVHRDLKPDNVVLVERAGRKDFVKVLDFGIAKRTSVTDSEESRLTQQGMVVGTPPYMSPEQFAGKALDARSDIYSLGVMAYEMLTGKLPFEANTAWEWAAKHMTAPPVPIESLAEGKGVPRPMQTAVACALAKSPSDRFQTVREFMEAFSGRVPALAADAAAWVPALAADAAADAAVHPEVEPRSALSPPALEAPGGPPDPLPSRRTPEAAKAPVPYTPIAGSMAFPTPAPLAEPAPAARQRRRGRLLAVAGVLAAAGAFAFVVARGVGHRSAAGTQIPPLGPTLAAPGSTGPAASFVPPGSTVAPGAILPEAIVANDASSVLAPAGGAGAEPSRTPPHPAGGSAGSSIRSERPETVGAISRGGSPVPSRSLGSASATAGAPPGPGAPPVREVYDGPECEKARVLRSFGRMREARSWMLACLARGGRM